MLLALLLFLHHVATVQCFRVSLKLKPFFLMSVNEKNTRIFSTSSSSVISPATLTTESTSRGNFISSRSSSVHCQEENKDKDKHKQENGEYSAVFSNYLKLDFSALVDSECAKKLALFDTFNAEMQGLICSISEDKMVALQKASSIASIGSSTRIEGSQMTDSEVDHFLSPLSKKSFLSRDESEVFGCSEVLNLILESYAAIPLSENTIKQLHSCLLAQSVKDTRHRGSYKTIPNNVVALDADNKIIGVVFDTATPFATPFRMSEIVDWTNDQLITKKLHPLVIISIFVVVFLSIHPFQDGNGRLSRLLTTLLMLKAGYTYVPFSSMENIIENNKLAYYSALYHTQRTLNVNPNYSLWWNFFLDTVLKQQSFLQRKIEKLKNEIV